MAGEIQVSAEAGKTLYSLIRNAVGQVWNTSGGTGAFEAYATPQYAEYDISLTEQGTASAYYTGTIPSAVPAGELSVVAKEQIGGSVAESDPDVANGTIQWDGTLIIPRSSLATSGQVGQIAPLRIARGVMVQNFPFKLVSSADHITAFVSGNISGQISKDGGAFGALQSGAFTEIGHGAYSLQALTSGDLTCNTAFIRFTGVGISGGNADPREMTLITQRVSGQT